MTFKSKAQAGQNAKFLIMGDSMVSAISARFSYKTAQQAAAAYPSSTVVLKERNPGAADSVTTIQTGTNGQTLTIIADSVTGSTSYRADQRAAIFDCEAVDSSAVMLGVNDVVNFSVNPTMYNESTYYTNMRSIVEYGQQSGYEMLVITPAWGDAYGTLQLKFAGIAWLARRLAIHKGCKCIDLRKMAEGHYTNTGNDGLGPIPDNWSDGDPIHLNAAFHTAAAALIWQTLMA